jgi:hypothetical protein
MDGIKKLLFILLIFFFFFQLIGSWSRAAENKPAERRAPYAEYYR